MRIACALLVVCGTALPQDKQDDLSSKVRELVELIRSDDLVAADEGLAELVKLGPPAIDPIKAAMTDASSDTRLRLESALKQIERNVRRERAVGKPIAVTLRVQDRPVAEALDELRRQSGKPIEFADLPDSKVTVDVSKASFWTALDGICRSHGGVMWRLRGSKLTVESRPYRDVPKVIHGNLLVYLDEITSTQNAQSGGKWSHLSVKGRLAWIDGARPQTATLTFDDLEDDKGVSLTRNPNNPYNYGYDPGGGDAVSLSMPLNYTHQTTLDEAATELVKCKGSVALRYVLETKRIITIPNPAASKGQSFESGPTSMRVEDCSASARSFSGRIAVTRSGEQPDTLQVKPTDIVIVDKAGKVHTGKGQNQGSSSMHSGTSVTITWYYQMSFSLPEGAETASLDLQQAVDVEEVVLPFDFKGLKLK